MILRFLLIPYRRGPSLLFFIISSFGSVCVSLNREVLLSCYVLTSACFCCCSCSALLCVCRRVGFFFEGSSRAAHTTQESVFSSLFSIFFSGIEYLLKHDSTEWIFVDFLVSFFCVFATDYSECFSPLLLCDLFSLHRRARMITAR